MRYGKVSRCVICESEYHWAKECPQKWKNIKENDEIKQNERMYLGSSEEEKEYWKELEAIIDTGCNSSVCGEL